MSAKEEIREHALKLGFGALGFALPEALLEEGLILQKLKREGRLSPLAQRDLDKLIDPKRIMPDLSSILVALLPYYHPYPKMAEEDKEMGRISRYAWGLDYHRVMGEKLVALKSFIEERFPSATCKAFVDTGPLLEKSLAIQAGLGWRGKNTLLITKEWGSWVFIGEILVNVEFPPDEPNAFGCNECSKCIDSCPTKALEAYVLDPNQCLSHATMWGQEIPERLRPSMDRRIWGCDTCQDCCPYNQKSKQGLDAFAPKMGAGPRVDLSWILSLTKEEFKKEFGSTSIGWKGLKRLKHNAQVAIFD